MYVGKSELEAIATWFNLVDSETVAQANGLKEWQMPEGNWCWGWGFQNEDMPHTESDPTQVRYTTNSYGRGIFSLDGRHQPLGTDSIDLGDGDLRSAVLGLSTYYCETTGRRDYERYCHQEGMRVGSKASILSFMDTCVAKDRMRMRVYAR